MDIYVGLLFLLFSHATFKLDIGNKRIKLYEQINSS